MNLKEIASAYDAIAEDYDQQVSGDAWMRQVLWEHYARVFRAGQHVLDVSCGTGSDAIFLAQRGIHVTGIDISPAMIAQLRTKVAHSRLAARVDGVVLDVANLSSLPTGTFDGLISAFAGLNTVPDLGAFASDAARLLRPGGRVVLHVLNRFSLWEWLGLVSRGQWTAARRLGRQTERDFGIGSRSVRHYLFSPAELYSRHFAPHFQLLEAYSLGVLRPPHTVRRLPAPIVDLLGAVERRLRARRPFLNWGRFFVLDLERR